MGDEKKKDSKALKPKFKNVEEFLHDERLTAILKEAFDSGLRIALVVSGNPVNNVWEDLFKNEYAMLAVAPPQSLLITAIANQLNYLKDEYDMPKEVALGYVTILTKDRKK